MGAKTKTGFVATIFAVLAFILVLIAFVTPYWLESDGHLTDPKFVRLGLWEVCFRDFSDPRHYFDEVFTRCWGVFQDELYIIHDILFVDFFVATQLFFTITFVFLLISTVLIALYLLSHKELEEIVVLVRVIGGLLVSAAISGSIAVIVFGALGDSRNWMPHWEHNDISWSYAMAVIGVMFLYVAGILFIVEGRVGFMRKKKSASEDEPYEMRPRPSSSL